MYFFLSFLVFFLNGYSGNNSATRIYLKKKTVSIEYSKKWPEVIDR